MWQTHNFPPCRNFPYPFTSSIMSPHLISSHLICVTSPLSWQQRRRRFCWPDVCCRTKYESLDDWGWVNQPTDTSPRLTNHQYYPLYHLLTYLLIFTYLYTPQPEIDYKPPLAFPLNFDSMPIFVDETIAKIMTLIMAYYFLTKKILTHTHTTVLLLVWNMSGKKILNGRLLSALFQINYMWFKGLNFLWFAAVKCYCCRIAYTVTLS